MLYLDVFDPSRLIEPIDTAGKSWLCRVSFKCDDYERTGKTVYAGKVMLGAGMFAEPAASAYGFVPPTVAEARPEAASSQAANRGRGRREAA